MRPSYRGQLFGLTDSDEEMYETIHMLKEQYVSIRDYPNMFVCEKTDSARIAKEVAGRHEKGTFAWGRYCFAGDETILAKVRKALTEP